MTDTLSDRLATAMNDPAKPFKMRLFKNSFDGGRQSIALTDIVEADFAGYAPAVCDDFVVTESADESVGEVVSGEKQFIAADTLESPQIIYGLYVTRHPGTDPVELHSIKFFDPPIVVVAPGQEILQTVRIWGEGV